MLFVALGIGAAIGLIVSRGTKGGGYGWRWFLAWAVASALFVVAISSMLGLLLGPIAVPALLWVGRRSPYWGEALGALVGFGLNLVVFANVADWRTGWFLGCAAMLGGLCGYAQVLTRREAAG